ncbi:hypothetical protein B7494_g8647 [Chlorociboria aeruginascens]|nr:hypothetical protein B7494_g8647 [Chlorociboria aeruginascens]
MAATTYPPGGTFLDTMKKSFVDVPIDAEKDNAIATTEFLEAAESLTTLFDVLGSVAFTPVKNDMLGNVKAISGAARFGELAGSGAQRAENEETYCDRGASAAEELSDSFRSAYTVTLKPHHSMFVKPIFSAAMSACPYRKDFYEKLGADREKVESELRVWLAALSKIIAILKGFLDRKEAKW